MDGSSPLAAMQPPSLPFGHGHWNLPFPGPRCGSGLDIGRKNFNFKDLSMQKNRPLSMDYFNVKPSRGSSPTASLAVDLSQNLHVDQSPDIVTPRRSLFATSSLFGSLNANVPLDTPPTADLYSPCPINDSMDISPLPHKPAFQLMARVMIQSPTPEPTPDPDAMLSSPWVAPESPLNTLKVPERKRPAPLRPTLSRAKGFTTSSIPMKSAGLLPERPPTFIFGNEYWKTSSSVSAFDEGFGESPIRGDPVNVSATGLPRPRSSHQKSTGGFGLNNGSPLVAHVRKPLNTYQRPRKHFRRSLSMFEHPGDVLNDLQAEARLDCSMDIVEPPQLLLPHFIPDGDYIPRITKETMVEVLDGKFSEHYERTRIIDCRFEYEYNGGHIDGADNHNNKEELAHELFTNVPLQRTLLIFHCEYSAHRAPLTAKHIREADRIANVHQYPMLSYPEIYILDGGYSSFFTDHKSRCYPQNYIEMNDKDHETACERGLGRIKQTRCKLGRAQTFAIGQHGHAIDESPIATSRACVNPLTSMSMDICTDDQNIGDTAMYYERKVRGWTASTNKGHRVTTRP